MSRKIKPTMAIATYPLPVVAFLLGVGRNATYHAASDAVFPTLRVRGRVVAIAGPLNRLLELDGHTDPRVVAAYKLAGLEPPMPLPESDCSRLKEADGKKPTAEPRPVHAAPAAPAAGKRKLRKGETAAVAS